jgi:hypothetical protein
MKGGAVGRRDLTFAHEFNVSGQPQLWATPSSVAI